MKNLKTINFMKYNLDFKTMLNTKKNNWDKLKIILEEK
jgi:hypothetical protein